MNSNNRPSRERLRDSIQCETIFRIIERGHDDSGVADVEIRVAGGKALTTEVQRRGHGEWDNVEASPLQPLEVFFRIGDQHNGVAVYKAA